MGGQHLRFVGSMGRITTASMSFGVPLPESESEFPSYTTHTLEDLGLEVCST